MEKKVLTIGYRWQWFLLRPSQPGSSNEKGSTNPGVKTVWSLYFCFPMVKLYFSEMSNGFYILFLFVYWCLQKCQKNRFFCQISTYFYLFNDQYYYHLFFGNRKVSWSKLLEWTDLTTLRAFKSKILKHFWRKLNRQRLVGDLTLSWNLRTLRTKRC